MSASPITPATPARTTTTRIEQPTTLGLLRVAWVALLLFQLVSVAYLIPSNLTGNSINIAFQSEMQSYASTYFLVYTIVATFTGILALVLSIGLMWLSRGERTAVLFSFIFLAAITGSYASQSVDVLPSIILRGRGILSANVLIIIYLFPDMRFTPRWMRYPFFGIWMVLLVNYALYDIWANWVAIVFFPSLLIGIGSFIYRYRRAIGIQRQQIKWLVPPFLVAGIIFTTWISVYVFLPPSIGIHIQNILALFALFVFAAIPLAVGLAVLRYRLWDIDLIINRTLVYGAITVLITALFFALLFLTQTLIGQTQPVVALLIAAPIAIFAFNPTQRFIQRQIDRRIFRLRYDLNEVAAAQKKPDIKNPGAFTGKVFGDYEALGVLGRGGMGEVYKGFGNNETVAIKLLLPDLAQQSDFRQRFEREAQTLARLNHPNIVKLKASGISDEVHFLAMDYIEGEELSAVVKRGAVSDYEALNDWLRDIASALDYLHAQGMVHRDLKASNIMLHHPSPNSERGDSELLQAVVMDFGIARTNASGTRLTGTGAVGTIDYMAPEQIMAARDVDNRADVYALGIIVYELLTGERPFKGSAGQVLFAHLQQPAPDPRDLNPEIPREMAKAVLKALAKTPDERFASAGDFVAALKTVEGV